MSQSNPTDPQIRAYAESYVLYGDQTKAFRAAFPDTRAKKTAVNVGAAKFHKLPNVCLMIEGINTSLSAKTEEEFNITVSDLKKMLIQAAEGGLKNRVDSEGNPTMMHNVPGAVSAISEINRMDGNHHQYKMEIDHNHRVIDDGSDEW